MSALLFHLPIKTGLPVQLLSSWTGDILLEHFTAGLVFFRNFFLQLNFLWMQNWKTLLTSTTRTLPHTTALLAKHENKWLYQSGEKLFLTSGSQNEFLFEQSLNTHFVWHIAHQLDKDRQIQNPSGLILMLLTNVVFLIHCCSACATSLFNGKKSPTHACACSGAALLYVLHGYKYGWSCCFTFTLHTCQHE